MTLSPEFIADCPYGPGGLLLDALLEVDRDASRVRVRMPTHDDLPLTREQRVHEVRHPRHVSGGLMVHMTGMVGFVHAYHVLDLRHHEGWIGYGGRIHQAKFRALARPGVPLEITCTATKVRRGASRIVARYDFRFEQAGTLVYEGDQTAMWLKIDESTPLPVDGDD
jgi:acyl-CoA thioesterase FadM